MQTFSGNGANTKVAYTVNQYPAAKSEKWANERVESLAFLQ